MTSHRVLCVEHDHGLVVALGTGGDDGIAHRRWTTAEVRRAIAEGERFYTVSPSTGSQADVEIDDCAIRTIAEQVSDNDLHDLRSCRWR